jgi:hypothetical protein
MAHLLISQGGTRFTYSHGEENLLVTQLEDYLEGRECNFILRKNYNKIEKRVERWPDSTAYDYVFRPRELQQLCYYEYMMKYKKGFKTFKRINREQDLEISGNADCNDEESSVRLEFQDGHPGKRYAFEMVGSAMWSCLRYGTLVPVLTQQGIARTTQNRLS